MNKNFLLAQDICIKHAVQISDLFGLSDGMTRIIVFLYMSPEAVSIPAICEKLSLTKGTVSLYLRMLEQRKIITRDRSKRQGKQKFYEINPRLWHDILEDLRVKVEKRFEITEEAIEKSMQIIQKDEAGYNGEERLIEKLLIERLERISEINNISRTILDRFLVSKSQSKNENASLKKINLAKE